MVLGRGTDLMEIAGSLDLERERELRAQAYSVRSNDGPFSVMYDALATVGMTIGLPLNLCSNVATDESVAIPIERTFFWNASDSDLVVATSMQVDEPWTHRRAHASASSRPTTALGGAHIGDSCDRVSSSSGGSSGGADGDAGGGGFARPRSRVSSAKRQFQVEEAEAPLSHREFTAAVSLAGADEAADSERERSDEGSPRRSDCETVLSVEDMSRGRLSSMRVLGELETGEAIPPSFSGVRTSTAAASLESCVGGEPWLDLDALLLDDENAVPCPRVLPFGERLSATLGERPASAEAAEAPAALAAALPRAPPVMQITLEAPAAPAMLAAAPAAPSSPAVAARLVSPTMLGVVSSPAVLKLAAPEMPALESQTSVAAHSTAAGPAANAAATAAATEAATAAGPSDEPEWRADWSVLAPPISAVRNEDDMISSTSDYIVL